MVHEVLIGMLECPVCKTSLRYEGARLNGRLARGHLRCVNGHLYQVKKEMGFLKDAQLSADEFEWKVNVADERKYDEITRQYASYLREDQKAALKKLMETMMEHIIKVGTAADHMVLDVASGMGRFIIPLAKKSPSGFSIVGTDIDEKPLRGTMSKAKKVGIYGKVSLIVTDAKRLCFRNGVLSTVSSNFGFDNVPHCSSALAECERVLKCGGRVVFSSLWCEEGSRSMQLAEQYQVAEIASEKRLMATLQKAGLALEWIEKTYSGVWPYNPLDLLPVEGERYTHVIAEASKPND